MKLKTNLTYVFLCVGILNFVFLLDTILTKPEIEFSLFLISTTKTINIIYYGIASAILFLASAYLMNNNKNFNNDTI